VFEDSLFATNVRRSPQRGVAAVLSFGVQAVFLSALVLIPLFYTDALPLNTLKSYVEIPVPPGPRQQPPPQQARRPPQQQTSNFVNNELVQPDRIPPAVTNVVEDRVPPPPSGDYIEGAIGGPATNNRNQMFRDLIASNMHPVAPPVANVQPKTVRLSRGVTEGLLIQKITPNYPALARQMRIQGSVLLQAVISRNGTIENLQIVSGHPMLVKAALDAVRQWRYRPYLLNNEPVEVETQITVNFTLGG
jgi:periplasmic protein TonB